MKRISILIAMMMCLSLLTLQAQYSSEAGKIKKLSDEYDQRGYANGKPVTVDGNLNISTATGVPSYVYPISSFTSNGHQMSVSLNYAGSVSFTTFHRYYQSLENFDGRAGRSTIAQALHGCLVSMGLLCRHLPFLRLLSMIRLI